MSTLKVDTIQKADGTGSLSVPAESGTVVTTASPSLGRRNLIINGAMQVAQRGTSETGVTSSGFKQAPDRFQPLISGMGTWTVSQSTDSPDGFGSSYKLACTTAQASPSASDYFFLRYAFEGQNLQGLKKGTSNAESMTLSFWVKSNVTGTGNVSFWDYDNTRNYVETYTISAADTWEYKTITVSGDTTGAFDNNNGPSLLIDWFIDGGTDYTSGSAQASWAAKTNAVRGASSTLALAGSTSNYLYITGVQLEVGSVATPFEHRSYGEELALCQRYYYTCSNSGYMSGAGVNSTSLTAVRLPTPVPMRSSPSISDNSGTWLAQDVDSYTSGTGASFTLISFSANHLIVRVNNLTGLTDNRPGIVALYSGYSLDAEL